MEIFHQIDERMGRRNELFEEEEETNIFEKKD